MSLLWARCSQLHGALSEFMGERGRRTSVCIEDGTWDRRSDGWQAWAPWLSDAPATFLADILRSCEPLRRAVCAMKDIRCELDSYRGPRHLQSNFRTVFEEGLIDTRWLTGITYGECYHEYTHEYVVTRYGEEWVLTTAALPVATLGLLTEMASVLLERAQAVHRTKGFEGGMAKPDPGNGGQDGKPKGGAPPNPQLPIWKAEAKKWKASGMTYLQVAARLKEEFSVTRKVATIEGWVTERSECG